MRRVDRLNDPQDQKKRPQPGEAEAALIQTPDGWGYGGNVPIGASRQHWNIPVRVNASRACAKGSKQTVLISNRECPN
jgi:hypothetical protein